MDRDDMDRVRDQFVKAARMADEATFDVLLLDFSHGYLMASFISPLTNQREDEYGGALEQRMRYPLEVFQAVRAVWPQEKPLAASISVSDWAPGGLTEEDAVRAAEMLREAGCDLIQIHAGQTVPLARPDYGGFFLAPYSDQVRNRAHIPTLVGGGIRSPDDVNTLLAAGRADLCILERLDA
jgi:anthraniloyl-CoA monooxygenase